MNSRFLLLFILFLFGSFAVHAQKNTAIIILKNDKATFTQSEHGSVTLFDLRCTAGELESIQAHAADMASRMTLTVTSTGKNLYSCVLNIDHQNHAEYVHKMLMTLGISSLEFEGKVHPLMDLPAILKGLNK